MLLQLPSTLSFAQVRPTLAQLEGALREPGEDLSVDVSALQHFDSSALAVLLECRRKAIAAGKTLKIQGRAPRLQELAKLYGIDALLYPA
jgi:phospholipid transport system transporter-binding protein